MKKIAIIGCGNLASAIIQGLYSKDAQLEYHTYTPSFTRADSLAKDVGGIAYKEISQIPECDYYLLGFKPQQLKEASGNLKNHLPKNAVAISLLAGASLEKLQETLEHKKIIRIMANTPILFGKGISLEQATEDVSQSEREDVSKVFEKISSVYSINDKDKFDYAMLVAASGPAYLMKFASHFISYLDSKGVENSEKIVKDLFSGTANYMNELSDPLVELTSKVTSKGGVTAEVLAEFEERELENIFFQGMDRGFKRNKELT